VKALELAGYRLKMIVGDRLCLALMVLLPLAAVLVAGAVGSRQGTAVPIAVVDHDRSTYSRLVIERLQGRGAVQVTEMAEAEAVRRVRAGRLEAAYIIAPGFEDRIRAGEPSGLVEIVKSPASLAAELIGEYLAGEAVRLASNVMAADNVVGEYARMGLVDAAGEDALWLAAWRHTDAQWEPAPLMRMDYREPRLGGVVDPSVPSAPAVSDPALFGLAASLAMFNALLAARWIVDDRKRGILDRLRAVRAGVGDYMLGHMAAVFIVGAATFGVTVLAAAARLHIQPAVSGAAAGLLAAYLLAVSGLSLLLGTALRSDFQLQVAIPFLTLFTAVLGSGLVNLAQVSRAFRAVSLVTPQGWLMDGLHAALLGGGGPAAAAPQLAVLLGSAAVCVALSRWWESRWS